MTSKVEMKTGENLGQEIVSILQGRKDEGIGDEISYCDLRDSIWNKGIVVGEGEIIDGINRLRESGKIEIALSKPSYPPRPEFAIALVEKELRI